MESMINRTYTMSDADTKPFCAATSVLASNAFLLALSRLSNNKAITAFAALLCFLFTANTHAQTLDWVKSFGGNTYDLGNSITTDAEGNVYTTGSFSRTADFDPGIGVMNLSSVGWYDVFIQKLDAQGNFLWAKSFGGKESDIGYSITIDTEGDVYITGNFRDTVDFDPGPDSMIITAVGAEDIFILKIDSQGNLLWTKTFGSNQLDVGYSIAIDSGNNIYITGGFADSIDFDPRSKENKQKTVGGADIFILKLDVQGNFLWAKSYGGSYYDQASSIAVDTKGNVYTIGLFRGTVDFNPGIGVTNLTAVGETDFFIQKLDAQGNFIWAKSFGGNYTITGNSIAIDAANNVYATGTFGGTVDFNPGTDVMNLSALGEVDIFVQKLDADGNFLWAKSFGGEEVEVGRSIAIDAAGNVYTTGIFNNTVDFNPGIDIMYLSSYGDFDIFVQKLDANGNFLWAKSFGGKEEDFAYSITANPNGNIFTTGTFYGTVDFDPGTDKKNKTSVGGRDVFVHKMKQTATGVTDMGNGIDISLYPNPSNGFIHISLKDNAGNAIITITDLQGKLIHSEEMSAATTSSIDIQAPDGVYFVNVKTAKGQTISKFIKEQSSVIFPNR